MSVSDLTSASFFGGDDYTPVYPPCFFPQEMPVPWYLETQLFLQPELRQQRQGGGAEGIAGLRREPLTL